MPFNPNYPYFQQQQQGVMPNYQQPQFAPLQQQQMWGQPQMQQPQPPQFKTNKIFVESLDEAMSKPADVNSSMIYVDRYKPYIYEIYTDLQNVKHPTTIPVGIPAAEIETQTNKNNSVEYVTREEFDALQAQFSAFNDKLESLSRKGAKKNEPLE